jgi:hypothetical protein
MGTMGYATISSAKQQAIRPGRRLKRIKMKLSLKQRIRNWLLDDDYNGDIPQVVDTERLSSDGMRLQVYRASGGFVIETRSYDRRKDENVNNMYVINEDKDLGNEIGKIITMESLR